MLPSDVSLHVCVRTYILAKTLSTPPFLGFRESSYLFCSSLQRIRRKHNVRRVFHQPSVNFEEQRQKGKSLQKVWRLILLQISFESLIPQLLSGRFVTSICVRGQIAWPSDALTTLNYMFLSSIISRDTSEELSLQASYLMENLSRVCSRRSRDGAI